ncbi:hypothetical protein [Actinoallomurus sp. NPDC050550]|uniref:hypothetical protein n=1 Tax=Actinoallomurus sp. NPDC050550 TaxID=3154937 RepID=UPI003402FC5C
MTTFTEAPWVTRLRAAWTAAHKPVARVPRWARIAAYTIPFTVLPSSLWRVAAVTFHAPIARGEQGSGELPSWLPMELYVVVLSIFSELLAFTAVGLISAWGEVFPRWVPGLRGRNVPVLAAVIPAAIGAGVLTFMWTSAMAAVSLGRDVRGRPLPPDFPLSLHDWKGVLAVAAYAPLLLWGPLLAAVTVAYWKRRRRTRPLEPARDGGRGEMFAEHPGRPAPR